MSDTPTGPPPFNDVVLAWLQANLVAEASGVAKVEARGTDWAGDSGCGFHPEFETVIWYFTAGNAPALEVTVSGEQLEHLWRHVMAAWPTA